MMLRQEIMFVYFLSSLCLKIEMWGVSSRQRGQGGWGGEPGPSLKSDTRLVSALTVNLLCPAHPPTTVPGNVPLPSLLFFFSGLRFYLRDLTQQWCSVKLCKTHLFSNFPEVVTFVQHLNIFVVEESTGEQSHLTSEFLFNNLSHSSFEIFVKTYCLTSKARASQTLFI